MFPVDEEDVMCPLPVLFLLLLFLGSLELEDVDDEVELDDFLLADEQTQMEAATRRTKRINPNAERATTCQISKCLSEWPTRLGLRVV